MGGVWDFLNEKMLINYVNRYFYEKNIFLLSLIMISRAYADVCNVGETLVASCNLPGEINRTAAFCANDNHSVRYFFKKIDSIELQVSFDAKNKLKRWLDLGTYTTYLGFNKGSYSYVLGIPEEKPGVVAFFDIKKWKDYKF